MDKSQLYEKFDKVRFYILDDAEEFWALYYHVQIDTCRRTYKFRSLQKVDKVQFYNAMSWLVSVHCLNILKTFQLVHLNFDLTFCELHLREKLENVKHLNHLHLNWQSKIIQNENWEMMLKNLKDELEKDLVEMNMRLNMAQIVVLEKMI